MESTRNKVRALQNDNIEYYRKFLPKNNVFGTFWSFHKSKKEIQIIYVAPTPNHKIFLKLLFQLASCVNNRFQKINNAMTQLLRKAV